MRAKSTTTRLSPPLALVLLVLILKLVVLIALRVSTESAVQSNSPTSYLTANSQSSNSTNHLPSSSSVNYSSSVSSTPSISSSLTELAGSLVRQLSQLVEAARPRPYTEREVEICAKLLYGEARGCTVEEQKLVIWCICNRADKYGQTIEEVATAPQQFLGYSSRNPVLEELCSVVREVLDAWVSGEEALVYPPYATSSEYLFFYGDGVHNWFRENY